jgi:hypothetical protein
MGQRASGSQRESDQLDQHDYESRGYVSGEQVTRFWGKVVAGASKRMQERRDEQAQQAKRFQDFKFR